MRKSGVKRRFGYQLLPHRPLRRGRRVFLHRSTGPPRRGILFHEFPAVYATITPACQTGNWVGINVVSLATLAWNQVHFSASNRGGSGTGRLEVQPASSLFRSALSA